MTDDSDGSAIPTWWLPPQSECKSIWPFKLGETTRRIDDVEDMAELIRDEASERCDGISHSDPIPNSQKFVQTGIDSRMLTDVYYMWEYEKTSDEEGKESNNNWIITEKIYLSPIWRLSYALIFLLIGGIGLVTFEEYWLIHGTPDGVGGIVRILSYLIMATSLFIFIALATEVTRLGSVSIIDGLDRGYQLDSSSTSQIGWIFLLILSGIGTWLASSGEVLIANILAVCTVLGGLYGAVSTVNSREGIALSFRFDIIRLELPVTKYHFFISLFSFSSIFLITNFEQTLTVLNGFVPGDDPAIAALAIFLIMLILPVFSGFLIYLYNKGSTKSRWKRNNDISGISTPSQVIGVGLMILVTYSGVFSLWYFIFTHVPETMEQNQVAGDLFAVGLFALLSLPAIYLLTGLARQAILGAAYLRKTRRLIHSGRRLEEVRESWDRDMKYPVIVDETSMSQNASAIDAFGQQAIKVTRPTLEELDDDDELAAILAHEEGHLEHGDTKIRSVAPFIGSILGLSQAVIYAILDFRTREYKADMYAKQKESPEDLLNALEALGEDDSDEAEAEAMNHLRHGPGAVSEPSAGAGLFEPLFSGFTIDSHPLMKDRKQAIDETKESPPEAKDIEI